MTSRVTIRFVEIKIKKNRMIYRFIAELYKSDTKTQYIQYLDFNIKSQSIPKTMAIS